MWEVTPANIMEGDVRLAEEECHPGHLGEQSLPRSAGPSHWGSPGQCWNLWVLSSLIHLALHCSNLITFHTWYHVRKFGKCCYEGWPTEMWSPNQDWGTPELSWGVRRCEVGWRLKVFVYLENFWERVVIWVKTGSMGENTGRQVQVAIRTVSEWNGPLVKGSVLAHLILE